ncbi:transglycosylase SLT domain-containing protein [Halarcobacter anaerophilus]|uniref:Transglycosylase SLT domain-containing protein n=1 Tax=Halarcobacter anaerophilus TaxID=877500 RepID=A0A4Q0Y0T3_9BACT|nr:transglycosylase SLT domain-containing protein [Halarcobacter anaerophilus]QDF29027.1 soluble lytic murein transglycosylase [Halarcobacter anaerophilus]RXJ63660.1 hypothetical protein CRV06_05575 [Halarcobacter anaerophilus]
MKKILLSLCLAASFYANEIEENIQTLQTSSLTLDYLKTLPKNIKRDFFINEYLKKNNISNDQAYEALNLIYNINNELFYNFASKFGHDETFAVAQCMNMKNSDLVDSYADCIVNGLSLKKASLLSSFDLNIIIQKTKDKYPAFTKKIKVISSAIPFTRLIVQDKSNFYDIFLNVDSSFREKYFNYKLPKRTFEKIYKNKKKFEEFLKLVLSNNKLTNLNKNLNGLDDKELGYKSSFYLAINAIRFKDFNKAYNYLENAKKKSSNKKFIDKVDFLEYLITKDESILKLLSSSENFNFYSYYANELLGNKISKDFKIDSLNEFKTILKSSNSKTIALLYAIAKSQSNLELDKVSKDLKVGIMQLKPVWIKDLSKEYNFNSFFNMEDSLTYAKAYLERLNIETNNNLLSILFKYNKEVKNLDQITALSAIKKDDLLTSYIKLFPLLEGNENYLLWYTLAYNKLDKKSKERLELNTIWENL